jgi:hypothetical protein
VVLKKEVLVVDEAARDLKYLEVGQPYSSQ